MDAQSNDSTYEAPRIEDHGGLAELTAGTTTGERLDHTFPVGTPKSELTFSEHT